VKLAGHVALITGGGGAMGGAQARLFAAEGASVCTADLFSDKARAVAEEIGAAIGVGLDTILTGSFLGTRAVIPSMRRAGHGVVLNLGSLASIRPGAGSPAYAAAKTGLVGLTRSTAATYAAERIRCVLLSPGHVDTPFIRANSPYSRNDERTSIDNPANYERRLRATLLGRLVTPEDVARAALFAVSDDAAMFTGSMLTVDGGAAL
jgi:NAD(P)-dependent dehydrogenase (short-subunit alcohol dehydrogenase family)